jgi:hypothetical protein
VSKEIETVAIALGDLQPRRGGGKSTQEKCLRVFTKLPLKESNNPIQRFYGAKVASPGCEWFW